MLPLRFYTKSGYTQLNQDQKKELYEFRSSNNDTRGSASQKTTKSDRFNKKIKGIVSELLAFDEKKAPAVDDALKGYILSIVGSKAKETTRTVLSMTISTLSITIILKSRLK